MNFSNWGLSICLLLLFFLPKLTSASGLKHVETADGIKSETTRDLVQWTHSRLSFHKPLKRLAVGQEDTMQVQVLSASEALVLAKKVGRTSIIVWYTDETTETFLFSVVEDMSVLENALKDIHPGIQLELAPDRAALVLRGLVPTIKFRTAAEQAAKHYLNAGKTLNNQPDDLVIQNNISNNGLTPSTFRLQQPPTPDLNQLIPEKGPAIINLIKVKTLPLSIVEKVKRAIIPIGGHNVTVTRVQQGDLPNDARDILLMKGNVQSQVELVRILSLTANMLTGVQLEAAQLNAVANESGALLRQTETALTGAGMNSNEIRSNIARAKLLTAAGGRLISTIEVSDLPLVRVSIQMYEVNRRKLTAWRPDLSLLSSGYDANGGLFGLQGASSRAPNANQMENALQILGGALTNNFQIGNDDIAFDLLFSLMEQEGISRTLSRPNLTVLAGESATFSAGGEVPVPTAYAPSGIPSDTGQSSSNNGVFSGTQFKEFGIQLRVRAMVDENDQITLDLNPTISTPDTLLTQQIVDSTGGKLNTSAFKVRKLNTSTRLADGQPMVIGGLVSRDISQSNNSVPGASRIPLLGKLAQSDSQSDDDSELIIIVTPTLVREIKHHTAIWEFPSTGDLLDQTLHGHPAYFNYTPSEI